VLALVVLVPMTHHEARTLGDFLRRIAIDYVRYGYHRYVLREIPLGKDLAAIDGKLIETYGVTSCRMKRLRLRQKGQAVVQYLRFSRSFVLLATEGQHEVFSKVRSYQIQEVPLHIAAYSVGLVGNTVTVRVSKDRWREIERQVLAIALGNKTYLENALSALPFYRFPGVVRQKWDLVTHVNKQRKAAGLPLITQIVPPPHTRYRSPARKSQSAP
jgi:hypothetical protein